ncbi:hypothetical protein [Streptomyces sp. NPDC048462]|uniref:hypothetical protein n=1 Tax=Streptomyces sp. NPDC048462 TaxID=3365555 RepID=UPI003710D505
MRAYAARDRAAIVEHLAHLEAGRLEFTAGVLRNAYNDTLQVLRETGCPHKPGHRGPPGGADGVGLVG